MEAMDIVEANYIKEIVAKGLREDGRKSMDFRDIKVTKGVLGNAEGSAQVELGMTKVLAGVKMSIEEPMDDTPNMGNFMVSAELLPLASENYETGPPSPESIELARVVDRGIRAGGCIDLESLLIEEGKVWTVFADIYVLNYDGNLFDAASIAVMSALADTKVPKVENGEAKREDRSVKLKLNNIVSSCTFGKFNSTIMLDTNASEEKAMDGRITIATDGKAIRAIQKGLKGGFFKNEIEDAMNIALEKHEFLKGVITGE